MHAAVERGLALSSFWDAELRKELPADADVFDAHTHLGDDIDGMKGRLEELVGIMDGYGISRAFMFCMDEPDRHPEFRAPNDRTLAAAARSEGRLIPFVRLDLSESPIEEARRCLELGARGIKLHPRAQRFLLNDERLAPVFAVASEFQVPILIHGGRGLPPIAADLERLHDAYPDAQLIIAHAGIADLAGLAAAFSGEAGIFFDTSVWSPVDLLDFYRQVSPEQVVYASDYPYGQQPSSLLIALRTARAAGFDEAQLRAMLAGTANRIADGEAPLCPTAPLGSDVLAQPMVFARIHGYLSMATSLLWLRQPDTFGVIGLALNACDETGGHADELERLREILTTARELWQSLGDIEDEGDRLRAGRLTFKLLHIADILTVTGGIGIALDESRSEHDAIRAVG
ncbi:MAG TPA: amidohydrolase family protein [Gaiellaceae bacterium]|nr:amidohydrolase family protein [Gaiellaceae bacterium]